MIGQEGSILHFTLTLHCSAWCCLLFSDLHDNLTLFYIVLMFCCAGFPGDDCGICPNGRPGMVGDPGDPGFAGKEQSFAPSFVNIVKM